MIVIVEGIDGSGKSTLCECLQKNGYDVLRREKSDDNFTYEEFRMLQRSTKIYVIDRALLTPWAYRLLNDDELNEDDFSFEETIDLLQYSPIIYCNCSNAFAYSILRGESNIDTIQKSNKLRDIYEFIIKTLKLYNITTVFEYDFEKNTIEDIINFIRRCSNAI